MSSRLSASLLIVLATAIVHAQSSPANSCLDAIPAGALVRAPVFVRTDLSDSMAVVFRQPLSFLTQSVAAELRRSLGGRADSVPHGDPAIKWRDVTGSVAMIARRDRSWNRGADPLWGSQSAPLRALAGAIDSVHAAGDLFDWPDEASIDSLMFRFELVAAWPNPTGQIEPLHTRTPAFPVLTIPMPPSVEIRVIHQDPPAYPDGARRLGTVANVMLSFYVNADGRVDTRSIVAEWPDEKPRPQGLAEKNYESFVAAAKSSVASAVYSPKSVGGCAVRSQMKQLYAFCLAGDGCAGDKRKGVP